MGLVETSRKKRYHGEREERRFFPMPKKVPEGKRQFACTVDESIYQAFQEVVSRTGRAFNVEVAEAMRRHVAAPPRVTVVVDTPEYRDEPVVEVKAKPAKKATRTRKGAKKA